jgi:ABC-2 type transport system ATP-binding protein
MPTFVHVDQLTKVYPRADGSQVSVVNGVSFAIEQGEIFSLLGPNGAGKSTTIGMISGLLRPTRGDAVIGGHSITQQPMQAKALMGVVPQEIALYGALSARQNLDFFGRMYGLGGAALKQRIDTVLDFIDLKDRQHDKVSTFSGGMKRRVNIGVGLLHQPRLVYMDEPTVGIDPQNRRRVLDTVLRLRDELGVTVLYTTHLMEEAQELSDRVAIIDHGQIIALGTVSDLTQKVGQEDRLLLKVATVPSAALLAHLQGMTGVSRADYSPPAEGQEGTLTVFTQRGRKALPAVISAADEHACPILSVEVREPDLEAVFLQLTGRALRD